MMQLISIRRLKSDVEVSLPPKHELKISVPMSEFQSHFYRALLMKDVKLLQKVLHPLLLSLLVSHVFVRLYTSLDRDILFDHPN